MGSIEFFTVRLRFWVSEGKGKALIQIYRDELGKWFKVEQSKDDCIPSQMGTSVEPIPFHQCCTISHTGARMAPSLILYVHFSAKSKTLLASDWSLLIGLKR